jgi:hypothetical protein
MLTRAGTGTSQTLTAFNIPGGASPAPLGNGTAVSGTAGIVTDAGGKDPGDGSINANWGVWLTGSITENVGTTSFPGGAHYLFGNLTPPDVIASKTGTLVMGPIGGTTPTSNMLGNATSFTYPAIGLNFTTRQATVEQFTWTFNSGQFIFASPATGPIIVVPGQGAGIKVTSTGIFSGTTLTGPATAGVSGTFLGPNGDHLGVAIGIQSTVVIPGTVPITAQGVQLYTRAAGF